VKTALEVVMSRLTSLGLFHLFSASTAFTQEPVPAVPARADIEMLIRASRPTAEANREASSTSVSQGLMLLRSILAHFGVSSTEAARLGSLDFPVSSLGASHRGK
jgi:hypothetical protein